MDWTQKWFLELVTVTHRSHHQHLFLDMKQMCAVTFQKQPHSLQSNTWQRVWAIVYRIHCSINTQMFGQQYCLMTSKCDTPTGVTFRIMTFDLRCTFTPETTIDLITSDHMKLLFSVVSVILLCLIPLADTDLLSNLHFRS